MNNKAFQFFLILFFGLSSAAFAARIDLEGGDVVSIQPNITTTVRCLAGNSQPPVQPISCTEECQKWYPQRQWLNNQWQDVNLCAFDIKCEKLTNNCFKKTECSQFQSTRTWVQNQWQDVFSCAGTKSTTSCSR